MTPDQAKLLAWAKEDARAATILAAEGLRRQAVSRAYYAMFCAARALLLADGLQFSSHSAVIAAFGKQFARTERLPRELHRYLIDKLAADKLGKAPEVRYVTSIAAAQRLAEEESSVSALPRPTSMAQLREVSEVGELMPHKSTFFYPKLATGLTIHQLYPDE